MNPAPPIPAPAPPLPPVPAPPPPPPIPPVPPPPPEPSSYAQGGLLGSFDWVQLLFLGVALGGTILVISYYRRKAKQEIKDLDEMKKNVDDLKMEFNGFKKSMTRRRTSAGF